MNTKRLRQKILDLAIHGKLVPQDPNDEPASVLLEKIAIEKDTLSKTGKIKISKSTSDTLPYQKIADIPFEIPVGWEWVRLGEVCLINPRNYIDDNIMVSFVPMISIAEGFVNSFANDQKQWSEVKTGFTHFQENDVGIAKITPCFENRKSVIFTKLINGYGAGTTELHIVRPIANTILPEYILWFAKTEDFILKGIKVFSGAVGQQRIRKEYVEDTLLPLPPLAEQKRIIAAIEASFNIINDIEKNKAELRDLIVHTKSKILNLAIRGKLTKQDITDEPAEILLERIAQTKVTSVKKISSDTAPYQKIADIPFEIPVSWEWVKLGDILYVVSGTSYDKKDVINVGIRILRGGNIQNEQILLDDSDIFLPSSYADSKKAIKNGDIIIVASTGSKEIIGKAGFVFTDSSDIQIGAFLRIIRSLSPEIIPYLRIIFSSKFYRQHIQDSVSGTNINNIKNEYITNFMIPFPPLVEQQRIVLAVETTFKQLDFILENIN